MDLKRRALGIRARLFMVMGQSGTRGMNERDLRRAWKDFIRDEEATRRRFQKRLERLLRHGGFQTRAQLTRHLKKEMIAANNRTRYADRKAAELCVWCSNPPRAALVGQVHCLEHARMNAKAAEDRRNG